MLNRDDYPTLTDEQWTALQASISSDMDRARTEASTTASKNAEKKALAAQQAAIDAAVEAEREKLTATEAERLDIDRKALAADKAAIAAERKTFTATKKLTEAGFQADKIESLLPLFSGVDDKVLDGTLDTFITTYNDGVKAQVDAEKVALLGGATPPKGSILAPSDATTAANQLALAGDDVGAADALLRQAGLVQ